MHIIYEFFSINIYSRLIALLNNINDEYLYVLILLLLTITKIMLLNKNNAF